MADARFACEQTGTGGAYRPPFAGPTPLMVRSERRLGRDRGAQASKRAHIYMEPIARRLCKRCGPQRRVGGHAQLCMPGGVAASLSAARCRARNRALRTGSSPPPPARPEMPLWVHPKGHTDCASTSRQAVRHTIGCDSGRVLGPARPAGCGGVDRRKGRHVPVAVDADLVATLSLIGGVSRKGVARTVPTRPPPPQPKMHPCGRTVGATTRRHLGGQHDAPRARLGRSGHDQATGSHEGGFLHVRQDGVAG